MNRFYGLFAVLALLAASPAGFAQYQLEGRAGGGSPSVASPVVPQEDGRYPLPARPEAAPAPTAPAQTLAYAGGRTGTMPQLFPSGLNLPGAFADVGRRCGTPDVTAEQAAAIEEMLRRAPTEARLAAVNIPVVFHVVTTTGGQGNVTDAQIANQMGVLNAAYAGMGITFSLQSINRVVNDAWYNHEAGTASEAAMKTSLAVTPAQVLNVYTGRGGGEGLLGYATFPFMYPENSPMHGVVLNYQSLPGGAAPYDAGDTGTHEVGHYLGLYHTFQGGCDGRGDYVADTPGSAEPNFGCVSPGTVDSCPSDGQGPDMVNNFMDYGDDACIDRFSSLQGSRVTQMLPLFKPTLAAAGGMTAVSEQESNNTFATAQVLAGPFPVRVSGAAEHSDVGAVTINYGGGLVDDIEDLYAVTTTEVGLTVGVGDFTRDLDLFLFNAAGEIIDVSNESGEIRGEGIMDPDLPAGTYYVGVSFWDGDGTTGSSSYALVVKPGVTSGGGGGTVAEQEPNNSAETAQVLAGPFPVTVAGSAEHSDVGALTIDYGQGLVDDLEDLYLVTTTGPGLTITLDGFNRDLDLFLISGNQILAASNETGETGSESIAEAALPAGTYLVGVSFWDGDGTTGSTSYSLRVEATGSTENNVAEQEPNNDAASAQALSGPSPVTVAGAAEHSDVGALTIDYGQGLVDDLEDLYLVTTTGPGLTITLDGFNRDLDLFLISGNQILAASNETGETGSESIAEAALPAGTYLVGVSFWDGDGTTGSTTYSLRIEGSLAGGTDSEDDGQQPGVHALSAAFPNPTAGRAAFSLTVERAQTVRVEVIDLLGRRVALLHDGPLAAGTEHAFVFDGTDLSAGTYLYRAAGEGFVETGRLTVVK